MHGILGEKIAWDGNYSNNKGLGTSIRSKWILRDVCLARVSREEKPSENEIRQKRMLAKKQNTL